MSDDWAAEQFRDECERMKQTLEALEAAAKAGTPKDALDILATEAGVGNLYRREE